MKHFHIIKHVLGSITVAAGILIFTGHGAPAMTGSAEITAATSLIRLGSHMKYLEDPGETLTPRELMAAPNRYPWKHSGIDNINFGYTHSVYWLTTQLSHRINVPETYLVEIAYPVLDYIDVHIIRDDVIQTLNLGDKMPFSNRPVEHRNFIIPIEFNPGETLRLLFRFKTTSSMQLPINLYTKSKFIDITQKEMMGLGIYYGSMLIMLLYNLFVFISVREINYLYYVIYVFCMAVFIASLNGISFQYLWPQSTWWNDQVLAISLGGLMLFAMLFTRDFLTLASHSPFLYKVCTFLSAAITLIILSTLKLPYRIAIQSVIIITILCIITVLISGIKRWLQGFSSARYYLIAWVVLLGGGVVLAMNKFGFFPRNVFTENATQFGSALEVMLLSFALADRLNIEKKERIEAQKIAHEQEKNARLANENALINERKAREAREQALEIQKKATETLEQSVEERTCELNRTLKKVETANNHILSSLRYARMIQLAMLPSPDKITHWFPDHFIIWQPRDIVGGDFYYIDQVDDRYIICVADCTGHGVPGAFMTMISGGELKRIVRSERCLEPDIILKKLNKGVKKTLKQDTGQSLSDDGLDIGICVINPDNRTLTFAGAKQNLTYIHNGSLNIIKGNKQSVGYVTLKTVSDYTPHTVHIEPGMGFYMATDGIIDQPGGTTHKRYGSRRLKEQLIANASLPLEEQKEILLQSLTDYRGNRDPVDDMTMFAFRPNLAL